MYTTCLFCQSDLGKNEAIESFPVGRRLAFDAAQGRLWVVCRKCERWNLTPVEERWEAVEQCERLFTSTRLRVSTDNIGLSRLSEGLELVRIGKPQRPEMAAWRYGDQFGKRRRRYVGYTVGVGVVIAGVVVGGPLLGFGSVMGGGWGMIQGTKALLNVARDRIIRTRVAVPGFDRPTVIRGKDLKRIVLGTSEDGISIRLPYNRGIITSDGYPSEVTVRGDDALRAASMILPALNHKGGKKEDVAHAVTYLEASPDPMALFVKTATHGIGAYARGGGKYKRGRRALLSDAEVFLDRVNPTMLLALEMAAHEDIERRAMEGELAMLEAAWRQAEEIAAISDNLLVTENVDEEFEKLKKG